MPSILPLALVLAMLAASYGAGCSLLQGGSAPEAALAVPPASRPLPASFAEVAVRAKAAVVNVSAKQTVKRSDLDEDSFGFPAPLGGASRPLWPDLPERFTQRSVGSGFFITSDGFVVTNAHVVANAQEVLVTMPANDPLEEREYPAKVIGSDLKTDVALVKIEMKRPIAPLPIGDSSRLKVGDWLIAIGNPFGLHQTVTAGIVSATGRSIGQGPYDDFIQTDASINPGNSGGPLINLDGEVVGINVAIFSESGGNLGIGFATPSNLAQSVISELRARGRVVRGWLGLTVQEVTSELALSFGLSRSVGALVSAVDPAGPGARAGLQRGDVIVSYDGAPIRESRELPARAAATAVGRDVELHVVRGGREESRTVRIAATPDEPAVPPPPARQGSPKERAGLEVDPLEPRLSQELGLGEGPGVLVRAVEPGGLAEEAGLLPGDVIEEVDRHPVRSTNELERALGGNTGPTILFLVRRGESTVYLAARTD